MCGGLPSSSSTRRHAISASSNWRARREMSANARSALGLDHRRARDASSRRRERTRREPAGVGETLARFLQPAAAQVDAPETQRLARAARRGRALLQHLAGLRGDERQRQDVEPVVLEHALERPGVAAPHEREVAIGNLPARHVAFALEPALRAFERGQPARRLEGAHAAVVAMHAPAAGASPSGRHRRRAGCSMSTWGMPANGDSMR